MTTTEMPTTVPEASRTPRVFRELLANTLATGVTSTFLWFALTIWVYLETRSVVATGVIGGAFSISSAVLSPLFGNFVDRHRKHTALMATTATSIVCFAVATAVFVGVDSVDLLRLGSPWFWLLVGSTLLGSAAGQMRGIVLSTCVTLLVPDEQRDRANGRVGTVTGRPWMGVGRRLGDLRPHAGGSRLRGLAYGPRLTPTRTWPDLPPRQGDPALGHRGPPLLGQRRG